MLSQLVVNQEVPDDDVDYVFVSPPTSLDIISPGSMTPKHEFAEQMINHLSGSWHNPPTLDSSTQHYDPVFRVTSVGHSGAPAIGGNYFTSSSYTGPYNDILYPSHFMMSPPPAAESSQFISAPQPTDQPYYNLIPLQHHPSPPLPLMPCGWLSEDKPCGFTGTLEEFKVHGKTRHFSAPGDAHIECLWDGCTYHKRGDPTVRAMRRDCIWRHTCEAHLGLKRLKKRGT
ncbi:uncharacterized protein EDB91DRAFT_708161 [Suillus paluster]|uniref:uncharacterized protein n=1 Tax=Suillus paluster TaxID=48578 RepID=UPI001B874E71|nr:uncharacterized protein EDB91DRAFT_708161 [Suillus paluster]KAG1731828.1 hypothetical protein EDB91DRAFT_708161 [Suillus paluster]